MAKYLDSDGVAYLWSKIKAKFAPIISPDLTGTPTAPTAATGTNTQQIATTAFVQNTVSSMTSGVSGVKGDAESTYRTGNVNLTPANIGAAEPVPGLANGEYEPLKMVVSNGSYQIDIGSRNKLIPTGGRNNQVLAKYSDNDYDVTWVNPVLNTDTKNTAGSNNSTSKLFLVGATSQTTGSNGVQTYSNSGVYATNGALVASSFNGHTLGAACEKAVGSVASGNTGLVTGGDVYTAIQSAAAGALQYQGTVTSQSGLGTTYKKGYYWIVGTVTAGTTIAGQVVETGDMIIAHADYSGTIANDIDIVQSNVDRMTNTDIDNAVVAGEAL